MNEPVMRRMWAMPNSETFSVGPIGEFVKRYLLKSQVSVDPFARNKRWAKWTNDLNPNTAAEYHLEALEFLEMLKSKSVEADLFILDPPYSPRQVKEAYEAIGLRLSQDDTQLGFYRKKLKQKILEVATPAATCLWFGWNSVGMGKKLGFEPLEYLMVCHGSDHNDTICVAEQRVPSNQLHLKP